MRAAVITRYKPTESLFWFVRFNLCWVRDLRIVEFTLGLFGHGLLMQFCYDRGFDRKSKTLGEIIKQYAADAPMGFFAAGQRVRSGSQVGTITGKNGDWYHIDWDDGSKPRCCNYYGAWEFEAFTEAVAIQP